MTLASSTSPLHAAAMYAAAPSPSPCASPATSTDSLGGDDARAASAVSSPAASAASPTKLPGLQFAISHRRGELCLPRLANGRAYDTSANAENVAMNHHHQYNRHHHAHRHPALYLSMPQCETPHYLPGVPVCPETSPLDKKSCSAATAGPGADRHANLNANGKKRKKGTRRGTLNAEAKNVLKAWMFSPEHFAHPYPSEEEKEELALEAGIEVKQLSNWFTNARKRLWQPVLRQSGVEVKNFLSTGRGGPRGNKLDVPANLQHLIAQKEAEAEEHDAEADERDDASPPSSPCPSVDGPADAARVASLKRSWSELQSSSSPAPSMAATNADQVAPKKKKVAVRKRGKDGKKPMGLGDDDRRDAASLSLTATASQLSQELRHALASHKAPPAVNQFKDIEILAAASLIGLHLQPVYQPVH